MWLEHRYAATLIAALVTEDPVSELGDEVVPLVVRLQASDVSPVDDIVVEGKPPTATHGGCPSACAETRP